MAELSELKKILAMSSRMLFNSGLVDYSGHISVRIPRFRSSVNLATPGQPRDSKG
jgi:hypothetical protein